MQVPDRASYGLNDSRRRDGVDQAGVAGKDEGGDGPTERRRPWRREEVGSRFAGRSQTVNVRSEEEGTFAAIRNDRRGYSRLNDSARNKYCSPGKFFIGYGNWMFGIG